MAGLVGDGLQFLDKSCGVLGGCGGQYLSEHIDIYLMKHEMREESRKKTWKAPVGGNTRERHSSTQEANYNSKKEIQLLLFKFLVVNRIAPK